MELHRLALETYGGSDGLRDPAGLESAVMQPQNVYLYNQEDLFGIAAAYAFHIAESQAFLDGNKRTAVLTAFVFLETNRIRITFDSIKLHPYMLQIARGELNRLELADVFRELQSGD